MSGAVREETRQTLLASRGREGASPGEQAADPAGCADAERVPCAQGEQVASGWGKGRRPGPPFETLGRSASCQPLLGLTRGSVWEL